MANAPLDKVRLDKWLWAARFYKTRSDATDAVLGGKIEVNEDAVKPAKLIQVGDKIRIRKAPSEYVVDVTGLAERRGSADVAATLYQETEASKSARERLAEQMRLAPAMDFSVGRPSKKDRRTIDKFRGRD